MQNSVNNRVLLLYPTPYKVTGLPVGLATLSAVLKQNGYEVKIFDTAFYPSEKELDQNHARADLLISKEIVNEKETLVDNVSRMEEDLFKLTKDFYPLFIGVSILEPTYYIALSMTRFIKKNFPAIKIIAGGVFPTLSPDIVFEEESIDVVCVGEGEKSIVEMAKNVANGKDLDDIRGLWIKSGNETIKNPPAQMNDIEKIPHPDYESFAPRLLLKPMQGRIYKMINIESSRGCPYICTYCGAPKLRKYYKDNSCGNYFRTMSVERVIEQINYQVEQYKPEFIYFSSESFLSMNDADFDKFVKEYAKVNLPFWFQTRIETISEDKIRKLKEVGLFWLTIGLEHGNEDFRKKVLRRNYKNDALFEGVEILKKFDLGASLNNIMGFPDETRELIFDTIAINKKLYDVNKKMESNIFMFTPYQGCELYDICKSKGLINYQFLDSDPVDSESCLNFDRKWKDELKGLFRTFNLYVKLPEKYYTEIKIAEQFSEEGNKKLRELKEFIKKSN